MSNIAIQVENLGKRYNIGTIARSGTLRDALANLISAPLRRNSPPTKASSFWALRNVSFTLEHGNILGIIGRNGSGKSTLLKMLARITRPTEGSLEVRGRLGSMLEVGVGFHPELTGRENVYLNGSLMGLKRAEINRRFDQIVDFSGIENFIDTPVKFYSSGMYIRLAFSTSVHLEPDILLIDEVLAVGDVEFQQKCLKKIAQMRQQRQTVIFVSHSMVPTVNICTEVIWLQHGRMVEQGDPTTVVSNYLRGRTTDDSAPLGASLTTLDQGNAERQNIQRKSVPPSEVVFGQAEDNKGLKVLRAYMSDERGEVVDQYSYETSPEFVVEYQIDTPLNRLHVGLRLRNDRDQQVMTTASSDCSFPQGEKVSEQGKHRLSVRIPGKLLSPGHYFVEIGFTSADAGTHFYVFRLLSFAVVGMPFMYFEQEVIRPALAWEVIDL